MNYPDFFHTLTERQPFPYQQRLATEPWPQLLDVPTGLGKTAAVVVAWLFRRLTGNEETGTRLVYCLPMRSLVQQTRDEALRWCEQAKPLFEKKNLTVPTVHLLMGGDLDEQWENSPEQPAILVGTQDMLLSRALNRGYAMSRFRWPMHFGLLNNDCFWVFDETQLIGVGIETSAQLEGLRRKLGAQSATRSLWMSATLGDAQLATVDHPKPSDGWRKCALNEHDRDVSVVRKRLDASKPIHQLDGVRLNKESAKGEYVKNLAQHAVTEHKKRRGLTLLIVNRVDRAQQLFAALEGTVPADCELGLVHSRFRQSDRARQESLLRDTQKERIVVATQAVEAGVDVSARTLITELAPWPSLVQRFGRCNRYGEEEAAVHWIDIDSSDDKSALLLPYDGDELGTARKLLRDLERVSGDAGPRHLGSVSYQPPDVVRPVLRRRDLLDLFDTSPDLSGNDIDVSRYVRDGEDTDIQFYWRDFEGEPTPDFASPRREELCRVSLAGSRDFLGKLNRAKKKLKSSQLRAWRWNALERVWQAVSRAYPGQVLLLHSAAGGYDPQLGWTGDVNAKHATPPVDAADDRSMADESDEADPAASLPGGPWVLLADHLEHVRSEATGLAQALGLQEHERALSTAGLWHDVGKAHSAFQHKLLAPLKQHPELPHPGEGLWAKSSHRLRAQPIREHFRHELASALAWLSCATSEEPHFVNLVAYLVAAHHGKVRMTVRSLPNEQRPEEEGRLFARGVWDGDTLPAFSLGKERTLEGVRLDLGVMRLGQGSWLERTLSLRDHSELGPFRLALLETVVRIADWRASEKEQQGAYDE